MTRGGGGGAAPGGCGGWWGGGGGGGGGGGRDGGGGGGRMTKYDTRGWGCPDLPNLDDVILERSLTLPIDIPR